MNVHSEAPLIKTEPIEIEVPLHEKFGQNLIVGIPSTVLDEESREILEQLKPAGIVLYQRNFTSQEQLKLPFPHWPQVQTSRLNFTPAQLKVQSQTWQVDANTLTHRLAV